MMTATMMHARPPRRRATLVLAIAVLLSTAGTTGLLWNLYRAADRSIEELLQRRLQAIGATAALWLPTAADPDAALAALAAANQLDDASIIDGELRLVADAHGRAGRRANLMRLDPDRARGALNGVASTGWAFDLDGARFFGGWFPIPGQPGRALSIEAGLAFTAPSARLRTTAVAAFALGGALGALALVALAWAARAADRERTAYGAAERAATTARMAAMVAHEVRNPLGIIRGGAELAREAADSPRSRELLDDILGEVDRINRLTEEFLLLGRDAPLAIDAVDLGSLARDTAEAARLRFGEAAPRIEVTGAGTVRGDEGKLRQALLNLVVNAAEAAGAAGRVAVTVAAGRAGARLVVEDSGPGVAPDVAARLFEPFVTGKASGTGLGLAISRKLIEQHGGRLSHVASSTGARFEITLPSAPRSARQG